MPGNGCNNFVCNDIKGQMKFLCFPTCIIRPVQEEEMNYEVIAVERLECDGMWY